ncbi:hypothetical protein BMS3Bbin06_00895 [bacterium BMS3Bbin06]|nr:hypothetical protein BMS3Bbin06_00895 [bacterium BMS3Bbin06]HDO35563.1 hypothetical protein [Nitrospirota bacterium]
MNTIKTGPDNNRTAQCPSCGREGKAVNTTTLHSLVRADRQDRITDSKYLFCGSQGCDIVYFTMHFAERSDLWSGIKARNVINQNLLTLANADIWSESLTRDGSHVFYKEDLTVRVGIKEESPPRPICYCFNHSVEEIFDEARRTGKSTVIDDIKSRIKSDGCSCEVKNPQGSCCLGTVKPFVNEALRQFGKEVDETVAGTGHKDCCRP